MTTTRLTRDLDEAMLGGVLAGLAGRYGWDVTLLRIVAVLVGLATGVVPVVLFYLVAWVIIPTRDALTADPTIASGVAADVTEAADPRDGAGAAEPQESATAAAAAGSPARIADEMSEALRDAAERLGEAATIAAEAARQAANQIGEVARRPRAVAVEEPLADAPPAETSGSEASHSDPADGAGDEPASGDVAERDPSA